MTRDPVTRDPVTRDPVTGSRLLRRLRPTGDDGVALLMALG